VLGHTLEFDSAGTLALLVLVFSYKRINATRKKQIAEGAHNGYTLEEPNALGDRKATYRYFS
jgi:hypothetical protein